MLKNQKPVLIDDQYLLTTIYYTGRNSLYYNAVHIQDNMKNNDILVQIVTNQTQCLCKLFKKTSDNGISPKIYQFGILKVQESSYHYIVQQKAGPSLKLCYQLMKRKLTIHTIALIALKLITHLSQLHELNIVHRCLKLSNIITSLSSEIFLTHFEYSSKYMDKNGNQLRKNKIHIQTNKFSSLGTHLQQCIKYYIQVPCPRDDLESLFYILLHIITQGKFLPSHPGVSYKEKIKYYYEIKQRFVPERELKGFPEQFLQLYHSIRLLQPNELPNYDLLKQPFFQLLGQSDLQLQFDWIPLLKPKTAQTPSPVRIPKLKHAGSADNMLFANHFTQHQTSPLPTIQEKSGLSIVICKQRESSSSSGNVSSMSDEEGPQQLRGSIGKL